MERYSEWSPSPCDAKGLNGFGLEDWLVLPVMLSRDSDSVEESNYEAALAMLREVGDSAGAGDSGEYEGGNWIMREFGHWGCGWFRVLLVRPETDAARVASDIEARLEDYPALDDEDLSARESEAALETWAWYDLRDRIKLLAEAGVSVFAARRADVVPWDGKGIIMERLLGI